MRNTIAVPMVSLVDDHFFALKILLERVVQRVPLRQRFGAVNAPSLGAITAVLTRLDLLVVPRIYSLPARARARALWLWIWTVQDLPSGEILTVQDLLLWILAVQTSPRGLSH